MSLFVKQDFTSHSGLLLDWKIECDALTDADIEALALMLSEVLPPFYDVYGVPRGGVKLEAALRPYCDDAGIYRLLVDDVLTTGRSMEEARMICSMPVVGAVLFARGPCPDWITPLFQMAQPFGQTVSSTTTDAEASERGE